LYRDRHKQFALALWIALDLVRNQSPTLKRKNGAPFSIPRPNAMIAIGRPCPATFGLQAAPVLEFFPPGSERKAPGSYFIVL